MSKEDIVAMHNAGASPMEIHRDLGVPLSTIYQNLAEAGLKPRKSGAGDKKRRDEEIVKAYQAGESVNGICARLETSTTVVYGALARAKVKIGRKRKRNEAAYEKAMKMYMDGATLAAITAETELQSQQIYQELYRRKIPLRVKKEEK